LLSENLTSIVTYDRLSVNLVIMLYENIGMLLQLFQSIDCQSMSHDLILNRKGLMKLSFSQSSDLPTVYTDIQ